jgi:polar amino acid transport system substrate-binding protein
LPKDIVFIGTPFNTLTLDFYSHKNTQSIKIIAAIRGFSYHGFRTKLTALGYEFFDLPNSISAIQLFLIKRSGHLISYRAPVQYLIEKNKLSMKDDVPVLPLANINIYYAMLFLVNPPTLKN